MKEINSDICMCIFICTRNAQGDNVRKSIKSIND